MSISITKKTKLNKTNIIALAVDKDDDEHGNKEFLHKIDVYKEAEYLKRFEYTIENLSNSRVTRFFIDHAACNDNNGYKIVTTEKAIKQSTSFTRFEFSLESHEKIVFEIEEKATEETKLPYITPKIIDGKNKDKISEEDIAILIQ